MAENTQTFILVGDFKDNITPKLTKLNREIGGLHKSFTRLQKRLRPISRDLAVMAESSKRIGDAFKSQRGSIDSSVRALRQYRTEAGRAKRANDQLVRSSRGMPSRMPTIPAPASVPRARGGSSGGGVRPSSNAAMAGGFVAGQGLANMMTGAIVRGFQIGTNLMLKPFQYGANAISERIADEMSDIKSAGGMFAVDKRENLGLFKSMMEARNFQEQLNAELAKSAAALPGETSQYVQQAKMITDTVMISYSKSKDEFMKFAKELDTGVTDAQSAMTAVLKQFTEKAVLLGQGEAQGAYGVPQIMEMMISAETVTATTFRKFAAYNRNPLLKNAVESAITELGKTGANTAERFRVVNKILQQAVPNEVVMEMSNSADGIIQAVKSAFLDPEAGLLGLGRKLNIQAKKFDALGKPVLDEMGRIQYDNISMFSALRDTIGGFVLPLTGILDVLPQLYEPLSALAEGFLDLREVSQEFYAAFNSYTKYYENEAAQFGKMAQAALDRGDKGEYNRLAKKSQAIASKAKMGGTLNALNDLLTAFGAIDEAEYKLNAEKLKDIEAVKPVEMLKRMFKQLFDSELMKDIGQAIGEMVGGILKGVGDLMAGANNIASAGPFAKGLKAGFDKAKGAQGITLIFSNLFKLIGKLLLTLFKSAPFEMSVLTALTIGMPMIQGAITSGLVKLFEVIAGGLGGNKMAQLAGQAGLGGGGRGGGRGGARGGGGPMFFGGGRRVQRYGRGGSIERLNRMRRGRYAQAASTMYGFAGAPGKRTAGRMMGGLRGAAKGLGRVGRLVPGGALAMGALDAGLGMAAGESPGKAIGSAVASTLGAAVGSIFGPVGTMIGGVAGGLIFDKVASAFDGPRNAQEAAAAAQAKAAAAMDKATANANARFLKEGESLGGVQALSDKFGGGAGLLKALSDPAKVKEMGLSPEDVQQTKILAGYMTQLNSSVQNRISAEDKAVAAERANTGDKIKLRAEADKAAKAQMALEEKMRKAWETTSTSSQNKLLTAAGALAQAIDQAANKLRRGSGLNTPGSVDMNATPTPNRSNRRNNVTSPGGLAAPAFGGTPAKRMGLAEAIQSEMKNKPAGSHLVIANSSETVIPAAGGYSPLGNMANALVKFIGPLNALSQMADQQAMLDGALGNVSGSLAAAAALAKSYGLTMTSFKRSGPANASYHNVGRAMDFSNSTGPTPQMLAFAQAMAAKYGSSMAELIYTPLGYGIKHGRKVPPYAAAGHYNHVHVAFGRGPGQPTLFSNANAAMAYERMMAPAGARVASVTANSSEFGGGVNLTQNITVDGAMDPKATAEAVWAYTTQAVEKLRYNNFG